MTQHKQFDFAPVSRALIMPNGFLHFVAPIFRVTKDSEKGIRYFDKDGKPYYQTVSRDLLEKTIGSFKGLPITDGHPENFLDSKNAVPYTKGLTGTSGSAVHVTDDFAWMVGTAYDEFLIQGVRDKKKREISPGYHAALKATDQSDVFQRIHQVGNHISFVSNGRNGSTVGLNLDSAEGAGSWDYCIDTGQIDADLIALIQRDLENIPPEFLDLTHLERMQVIDLDRVKITPPKANNMQTANLVYGSQVFTFQADSTAPIVEAFSTLTTQVTELKAQKDASDLALATATGKLEVLATEGAAQKTAFEKQIQELKDAAPTASTADDAAKLATSMFKILPMILAVKPDYQINTDSVWTERSLKQTFIGFAMPERKDEVFAWNLDDSTLDGAKNVGKLDVLFDLASEKVWMQRDSQMAKPYSNMDELKILLSNGVVPVNTQKDTAGLEAARKAAVAKTDSNF